MVTSIQLSQKTKNQLFIIKSKLQLKLGRNVTYEEVIEYLVSLEKSKLSERKSFSKQYFGTLDYNKAKTILKEGREFERK